MDILICDVGGSECCVEVEMDATAVDLRTAIRQAMGVARGFDLYLDGVRLGNGSLREAGVMPGACVDLRPSRAVVNADSIKNYLNYVRFGKVDELAALLAQGISTEKRNKNRQTPLMQAASSGNLEMVNMLLQYNADVGASNEWGCTALHLAATVPVVEALIAGGASCTRVTTDGYTPLVYALRYRREAVAQAIVVGHGTASGSLLGKSGISVQFVSDPILRARLKAHLDTTSA